MSDNRVGFSYGEMKWQIESTYSNTKRDILQVTRRVSFLLIKNFELSTASYFYSCMSPGAYLGGVLRVLEHPPQLGMHKIKYMYSLNYKHALGTYLIHPCITSLTAKFTKLEH